MVPAGRMTATARADIGARFQALPKNVGLPTDVTVAIQVAALMEAAMYHA